MAKLPDGLVFDRVDYVVMKGGLVVWPDPVRATTKDEAEEAARSIKGGMVMRCQVYASKDGKGDASQERTFVKAQFLGEPDPLFIPVKHANNA